MKKHSYGRLIGMSWNWTLQMLFRPFSLKKWIMLAIIILLAGQMGGGFNFNFQGKGDRGNLKEIIDGFRQKMPAGIILPAPVAIPMMPPGFEGTAAAQDIASKGIAPQIGSIAQIPPFTGNKQIAITAIIGVVLMVLLISIVVLLWMWIRANFSFVFIDSVISNDASLRVPFHKNKPQGNSYFKWTIWFGSAAFLIFGAIVTLPLMKLGRSGLTPPLDVVQIFSVILGYVPLLLVTGIAFLLIVIFATDFILPIMYKKKTGILKAWGIFFNLLKRNWGDILLYLLVKLGLSILALVAAIIIAIIGIIVLIIVGIVVGLIVWLIYAITPPVLKAVILILIGIPILVGVIFLFNMIFLPIPVFFRTFSIYVLGSMDESLDLFAPKTPEEITADADTEKYKRSMKLVWFTVLSPVIFGILALALALGMPAIMGTQQKADWLIDIEGLKSLPETITIPEFPEFPKEEYKPLGDVYTIHLKNGSIFEAEIASESEENIAFRVEGGTFVYPRADILRMEKRE